tara:strand:- start:115 stop:933 length:819 start_codon:yes stop_codon:yes gene_type:complete
MYFVGYILGAYNYNLKNLSIAKQFFLSSIKNTPSILKYNPLRVDAYAFIGTILIKENKYPDAIKEFSKAINEDKNNIRSLNGKANALHIMKRYEEAKSLYEKALRIYPDANIYYNYACVLALLGTDKSVVLDNFKKALRSGFTDIAHAKSDPELVSVHNQEEFKNLTEMIFSYELNWNMFIADKLTIMNESNFDWTKVIIKVAYMETDNKVSETIYDRQRLNQGESLTFDAFYSTKTFLLSVMLQINTEQGIITGQLKNHSGQLQLDKVEIQ